MYVVDVIPLASTAPPGSLSYRSAKKLAPGRIVSVKLRRRHVPGIVVECVPLLNAKARLKAAPFSLSGDLSVEKGTLPPSLMSAVERIAAWHAASRGAVLSSLFLELIRSDQALTGAQLAPGPGFRLEPVERTLLKRAAQYRAAITDTLAADRAALLVVSTLAEVEFWKRELGSFAPVVLSGSLTGTRRRAMLERAAGCRTLIIATPSFAWTPVDRLGLIIVERVGAGGFRLPKRPYLDVRVAVLELARARELPLLQGDFPLPLEFRAGRRRLTGVPDLEILDARRDEAEQGEEPWSPVPQEMAERIRETIASEGRVAVLAVRKGYAPVVVCRDCGETLKDERGKTYAFSVTGSGERVFRTSDGKSVIGTNLTCPRCGSWNLLPLGVGVERVYEELRALFPKNTVTLFDADNVRTAVAARKRLADLRPGSIVVGTEAMVPWLLATTDEPLDLACIASADTLLALPFWRARERFVRLGFLFAECARETLIATRMPDDSAVELLGNPEGGAFFDEEATLRKALGYPPFGTLIALTFEGRAQALDALDRHIQEIIQANAELVRIPDHPVRGTVLRRTLVLTLPKDGWPESELEAHLAGLPPSVRVMVDPESFW